MARRPLLLLPLALAALLCAAPAGLAAKRAPAAKVDEPRVEWVRVGRIVPGQGEPTGQRDRVVVRIMVRHSPLREPAAGVRSIGTTTVVLSRYEGERDYSLGGGSQSFALPVLDRPINVVYRILLNPAQSANVRRAAAAGTLRALTLVDQRAQAKGRAPALAGGFSQATPRLQDVPATLGPPGAPLLERGAEARVVVAADADGRPVVDAAEFALDGGRRLVLVIPALGRPAVPLDGSPVALAGTLRVVGPDGAVLAEQPAPAGFSLALRPTGAIARGTLTRPALSVPGVVEAAAASVAVSAPSAKRG